MRTMLKWFQSRHGRSFLVAVAITGAAAAVAAAVGMVERPVHAGTRMTSMPAAPAEGKAVATPPQRAAIRSPKDAGRLLDPPWAKPGATRAAAPGDASVPAAADALGAGDAVAEEPPATF